MAFSLLLLGVCWDPGDEPSETVTALPTGSAEAADALPGDSDTAPVGATDTSAATSALPSRSASTSALPGNAASANPTPTPAPPGRSTGPSGAPGPGTRTPQAPASRTAPAQGPGAQTTEPATGSHSAPGLRPAAGASHPSRPPTSARPQSPARTQTRPQPSTARPPRAPATPHPLPRSRATRLLIPYLRVDAPIMPLGLDRERRLTAPPEDNPKLVGWYQHGASPGEQGIAVAVGHLDTDRGPAVFAGLTELKRGREIKARRADGRIAVYRVDAIKSYEKDRFPNQEVYGARGRPELRLITCGGAYDRRKGYSGNVVVFAHLAAVR
ncbi:class F sortase [Streptomyces sp. NPDC050546]|uniref:class F sortase n=1 Tax=Streptomyces sp. NPDC050546 TaxID=3365628 RepID=UPI00379E6A53